MKPSVGRIVHYYAIFDRKPNAAIVTDVIDEEKGIVSLSFFRRPSECRFHDREDRDAVEVAAYVSHREAPLDGPATPGDGAYWTWPPRV